VSKALKKYEKHTKPGHVPEQDNHFTVTFLPLIDGFNCHDVKGFPDIPRDTWVEVIYRNGEHDSGLAECFSWDIHNCHPNDREDYRLLHMGFVRRKAVHDFIDCEITHWRTPSTTKRQVRAAS